MVCHIAPSLGKFFRTVAPRSKLAYLWSVVQTTPQYGDQRAHHRHTLVVSRLSHTLTHACACARARAHPQVCR